MRIVGLTGGFGTGKSFVASVFRKLGANVIDADKLGHKALRKGSITYKKVVAVFGNKILDSYHLISRKALADVVFANKKNLAKLNSIVHPGIIKDIRGRICKAPSSEILIIDAPLICETNITGLMNVLIVVKASKSKQVERRSKKFGMCQKDVCKRIARQMPLNKKIRAADYVVDNDGTKEETKKQVRKIWQELKPFGKNSGLYTERSRSIKKGA